MIYEFRIPKSLALSSSMSTLTITLQAMKLPASKCVPLPPPDMLEHVAFLTPVLGLATSLFLKYNHQVHHKISFGSIPLCVAQRKKNNDKEPDTKYGPWESSF